MMSSPQPKLKFGIDDIKILSEEPTANSQYIKPMRLKYTQAGVQKTWDYMKTHNSVAILIFNVTSQCIVLVRQFRPAVYMAKCSIANETALENKRPGIDGVTYELCAGLVDRPDHWREIAASEVLEETGYKVSPDKLELISKARSGVGITGSLQHIYYVEVTDDMKISDGGGCEHEGELIDLFHLKRSDIKSFMEDMSITNRPVGMLYALGWFLTKKI